MEDLRHLEIEVANVYERQIARNLQLARLDTPVVLLTGPRQVGKSTLARRAATASAGEPLRFGSEPESRTDGGLPPRYATLDDATVLAAAAADPEGWLRHVGDGRWMVIDEVQRLPELLVAIKREVDLDRRPDRFLLTGSADVMAIPRVAESLAGRVELLQMWPLSASEIAGTEPAFLEWAFSERPPAWRGAEGRAEIVARALRGGFPDALRRTDRARRNAWFASYVATVVQREIRSISNIENDGGVLRILRALASRSGGPKNFQALSTDTGIAVSTLTRYVELLKATFLVIEIPAWSGGVDARIIRAPKLLLDDAGLYGYLLNLTPKDSHVGFLVETFVGCELVKAIGFEGLGEYTLLYFRDREQREVDFVVETPDRRVVGIEVKASSTAGGDDFKGLRAFAELAGSRFHRGIVLYAGSECVPFGKNMWAVPISSLYENG